MCTNFIPTASDMLVQFGVERAPFDYKAEAYPGYDAPIVINIMRRAGTAGSADDTSGKNEANTKRECVPARFGLIPPNIFAEDVKSFVRKYHTNNARSETVAERRSFRNAWKKQQVCLIPVSCFFEPNWATGKAVRWKIWLKDTKDFAIAGLWEQWKHGEESFHSFTMLTVNADDHAVMRHFHRHGEERRMPVILHPDGYDRWLNATPEVAFGMCQQYPAALMDSAPAPKPRATAKIELPPTDEAEAE